MSSDRSRVFYLDALRCVALITMIMLHVSAKGFNHFQIETIEWNASTIINIISSICVPLFVMISGVFILDETTGPSIKKLYTKKIPRLFLAFFFWSTVYTIFYYFGTSISYKYYKIDASRATTLVTLFLHGYYHLWFIPMIIGLYILSPILAKIVREKNLCKYFILIYIISVPLYFL